MEKVCRTCHYFDASESVCTLGNFDTDNSVADEIEYMLDSGELLEILENELPDEKLKKRRLGSRATIFVGGINTSVFKKFTLRYWRYQNYYKRPEVFRV